MAEAATGADAAGELLLAICAEPTRDHAGGFAALGSDEWHDLLALARLTRTLPLVARALHRSQLSDAVPPVLAGPWREELRFHAMRTLVQAQAIAGTLSLLAAEGYRPIALKGLGLAYRDYPDPSLRPLRDLDLLMTADEAPAAQQFLLNHPQYRRRKGAGHYGIEHSHQLPELEHVESGLVIELHHRINARGWPGEEALLAMLRNSCSSVTLLGQPIMVPSPEANLLHLVEHATLHHMFGNGPLLLADLHFMACSHPIDWERLRALAETMQLRNALDLVLALAASLGAQWVPENLIGNIEVAPAHLAAPRRALLGGDERGRRLALQARLDERAGGKARLAGAAMRLLRPDPHELARYSGHAPDTALRWLGYPGWLREKGLRYWRLKRDHGAREAGEVQAGLIAWLQREWRDRA